MSDSSESGRSSQADRPGPDGSEVPADVSDPSLRAPDGYAPGLPVAGDPSGRPVDSAGPADPGDGVAPGGDRVDAAPVTDPSDGSWPARRRRRRAARKAKPRRKAPWWELPALIVLAIGIAILVKSFVIQPFYIPSESMEHTLYGCSGCHGDRILVNKPIYDFRDPEPGDIVVFNAPPGWDDEATTSPPSNPVLKLVRGFGQLVGFVPPDGQVLVKRVIATGGETVKGDSQGHVMVSDHGADGPFRTLNEPYVFNDPSLVSNIVAFGPVTIPKGRLWVMGDHRTDSADSRYHCSPDGVEGTSDDSDCDPTSSTVPVDNVIGKAFVIAWPPSRWRTLGTPSTFEGAPDPVVPSAVSVVTVVPLYLARRRRRRREP